MFFKPHPHTHTPTQQLQLSQFVLVIGHSAYSLHIDSHFPHWILYSLITFLVTLFALFSHFYVQEYRRGGRRVAAAKKSDAAGPSSSPTSPADAGRGSSVEPEGLRRRHNA